jgi:hypothetical protein
VAIFHLELCWNGGKILISKPSKIETLRENVKICIALTQPFRAALGAECITRVTQQAGNHNGRSHTGTSRSQNEKAIHCHRWDSNLRPSAR